MQVTFCKFTDTLAGRRLDHGSSRPRCAALAIEVRRCSNCKGARTFGSPICDFDKLVLCVCVSSLLTQGLVDCAISFNDAGELGTLWLTARSQSGISGLAIQTYLLLDSVICWHSSQAKHLACWFSIFRELSCVLEVVSCSCFTFEVSVLGFLDNLPNVNWMERFRTSTVQTSQKIEGRIFCWMFKCVCEHKTKLFLNECPPPALPQWQRFRNLPLVRPVASSGKNGCQSHRPICSHAWWAQHSFWFFLTGSQTPPVWEIDGEAHTSTKITSRKTFKV